MKTSEIVVKYTVEQLESQIKGCDQGSDDAIRNRAAYYAMTNISAWGLAPNAIDEKAHHQTYPLSATDVCSLLDDESLTPEDFYNAAYDYAEINA